MPALRFPSLIVPNVDGRAGDLDRATCLIEEINAVTDATGTYLVSSGALYLAASRGDAAAASMLTTATVRDAVLRGEGIGVAVAEHTNALLNNSLGRYREAAALAQRPMEHPDHLGVSALATVEFIEAAARSGMTEMAADAVHRLTALTRAGATDWARGIEARSRALVSDGDAAEQLCCEAIERLGRPRLRVELARAHLVFGEWLRRERRRNDARPIAHRPRHARSHGCGGFRRTSPPRVACRR